MFGSNKETADQAEATRSNAVVKKENSIIKIYGQPVLPVLTRIIFWLMIVLVAAMLLVDINAFARYDVHLGIGHLIKNITVTGFIGWLFFSCIILLLSCAGMHQNRKAVCKREKDTETRQSEESTKSRNERALKRLNAMYIRYIKVSLAGLSIWCIFYIAGIFFI